MKKEYAEYEAKLRDMIRNTPDKEETLIMLLDEANRIFKELRESGK